MYLLASMFPEKRVMEITMGIIMVVTMAVTIIRIDSIIEDDIIKRNHHLSLWDLVRSLGFFMFFSNLCYKTKAIILFKSSYNYIRYNWKKKIRFGMDIFHNKNDCKNHFLRTFGSSRNYYFKINIQKYFDYQLLLASSKL